MPNVEYRGMEVGLFLGVTVLEAVEILHRGEVLYRGSGQRVGPVECTG